MEPPDRKKRILVALVPAVIALAVAVNFFWPLLKDFNQPRQNGECRSNVPLLIFGGFFVVIILTVVSSVVRSIRKSSNPDSAAPSPRDPKPWLARPEWAAGKIKSAAGAQMKIFAVMALAFCGIGGLFTVLILPRELAKGDFKVLLVLVFPIVGIGFAVATVRAILLRRRFGDCFFEMASIPGAIGGTLEGLIQVGARLQPEHGLHLRLSCVSRTVTGSSGDRDTHERILWQDEKIFKNEADFPEPEPGRSGIPVYFKIPADQPECSVRGGETILWRLEANAKISGADFSATFDVPVFKVAGITITETDEADPTAALQMPVEEIRRDEHSQIQITDGPGGREFYFPAARNLGTAIGLTCFFLMWTGFTLATYLLFKDLIFEILFTVADVIIFICCVNLWFKSSRITIDSAGVTAVNRWLLFLRTRRFDAGDVARFDAKIGMTSGSKAYHCIKLVTRTSENSFTVRKTSYEQTGDRPPMKFGINDPTGVTIASGIGSKPEADCLVREMNKALGRRA